MWRELIEMSIYIERDRDIYRYEVSTDNSKQGEKEERLYIMNKFAILMSCPLKVNKMPKNLVWW